MTDYREEQLKPVQEELNSIASLYVPEMFLDEVTEAYEEALANTELDLIAAEQAAEMIQNMQVPSDSMVEAQAAYTTILQNAARYGSLLRSQEVYEQALEQLTRHRDQVVENSEAMEKQLEMCLERFQTLSTQAAQDCNAIAEDNHLMITPGYVGEELEVEILHIHREVPAEENFILLVLFCTLTGICAGAFLAVCREAKHRDVQTEKLEQM